MNDGIAMLLALRMAENAVAADVPADLAVEQAARAHAVDGAQLATLFWTKAFAVAAARDELAAARRAVHDDRQR